MTKEQALEFARSLRRMQEFDAREGPKIKSAQEALEKLAEADRAKRPVRRKRWPL